VTDRRRDLGELIATRLWPTVVGFWLLAVAAVFTSAPGSYVGDNRFDQFWNPGRRIARQFGMWDAQRALGREREDFWPGVTWPLAYLRGLGLDAATTQRLWHIAILVGAGVGMVVLLRVLRPRIGPEHLIAGVVVMFSAYGATFLVPSNLSVHFALAPWLVVAFIRGVSGDEPWRWAAVFALMVFAAGNTDIPGLLLAATPIVPVAFHLVVVERTVRWRAVGGWLVRAGVLSVGAAGAAITKVWIASGTFGQRLGETEAPSVSSATSSWSESFRGLGHWRSYFVDTAGPTLPQGFPYFNNPVVVAATFAIPLVALVTLALSSWRPRLLFGLMMLVSLVLMVAAFPLDNPSPLGRGILTALTDVDVLGSFRNTYKAGAGLVLGSAALFGIGVSAAVRRVAARRRPWAVAVGAVAGLAVALTGFPYWSGQLYNPSTTLDDIPAYWDEALSFLDDQSGTDPDAGVLVLPGAGRAPYRWGWPGDDLFEARTRRPVAERIGVSLSAPLTANLIEAVAEAANDPAYQPGTLGPALRRLGIVHVVVRNDLAWGGRVGPRPSGYDGLRRDPDLTRVATFGDPGTNTTAQADESALVAAEQKLPPVEIYEVRDVTPGVRAITELPPVVVSGDGAAWAPLATAGFLDGERPVLYSASADVEQLVDVLNAGAGVVVTDTNRRQLRVNLGFDPDRSNLLAAGQSLDRSVSPLFTQDGSESVAWFADAIEVSVDGPPRSASGTPGWIRPTNALDGDERTDWISSVFEGPLRRTLTVRLREPEVIDKVAFVEARTGDGPLMSGVEVGFSDGSVVTVPMIDGKGEATFTPRSTEWITVRATELVDDDGDLLQPFAIGFSEITIAGLDLREFVQVPDDLALRAAANPALAAALADAPMSLLFTRVTGSAFIDASLPTLDNDPVRNRLETSMRRRFQTVGDAAWTVGATVRADRFYEWEQGCIDVGLRIDDTAVPVSLIGEALPSGDGIPRFDTVACSPIDLAAGWHLLEADRPSGVDAVELQTGPPLTAVAAGVVDVEAAADGVGRFTASVVAPRGGVVSLGQSWDPRWRASLDGVDLGTPLALNTLAAWVIPATDQGVLKFTFGPVRLFQWGVAISAVFVLLAGWLALRQSTAGRGKVMPVVGADPWSAARVPGIAGAVGLVAAVTAAGWLVAGWWGLVAGAVAALALALRPGVCVTALAGASALTLVVAAAVTAANANWGSSTVVAPAAPANAVAVLAGQLAGALLAGALVVGLVVERSPRRGPVGGGSGIKWSLHTTWAGGVRAVAQWWPVALVAVMAAVAAVWRNAPALPPALDAAVADLARGFDPSASVAAVEGITGNVVVAPLGPVVVALAPVPATILLALMTALGVVVASQVGVAVAGSRSQRTRWRLSAVAAGSLFAVCVVGFGVSLPWLVALVTLGGATLLTRPTHLTARRAAGAGVCAGLAVLAVPVSAVAVGVLVLMVVVTARPRRLAIGVLVGALVVVAPWGLWSWQSGGGVQGWSVWAATAGAGWWSLVAVAAVSLVGVVVAAVFRRMPDSRVSA
jgi:hypothetical protein